MSGKYRPAQKFAFEAEGEIIIALCEKGDRGTGWSWWPDPANTSWKGQHVSTDAESPAVAHFWPAFVEGLMAAIGRPLTRPDLTFHPDTPHGARHQAHALAETLDPGVASPRLRL